LLAQDGPLALYKIPSRSMGRQPQALIPEAPKRSHNQALSTSQDLVAGYDCKPAKRFCVPQVQVVSVAGKDEITCDLESPLGSFLKTALPDKEPFILGWLKALASPRVCITSLEDVKRIEVTDVASLPVPPFVKRLFRDIIAKEALKAAEQKAVLELTAARTRDFLAPLRDRNLQPPGAGSKYFQDYKNYRLILTQEEIEAAVRIVAHRLETWCKGERIVLVGILKGAFVFLSDLCRALSRPYSVHFVEASSYKDNRQQGGMAISSDLCTSKFVDMATKTPHKVVLIDELLDNGKTMYDMKQHFLEKLKGTHTENDVLTVCLFGKQRAREWPEADITGIPSLPDLWLVGYGLDDRGTKRGWTELFAIPKVKIVGSIDEEEVANLLKVVDGDGVLVAPHVFAGFELPFKNKCRYRVSGLDVQGCHERSILSLQGEEANVKSKADIEKALSSLAVVKGKYEHELHFAFIVESQALVSEDEIFTGNNHVYAKMRCKLRSHIEDSARRCGVIGLHDIKPLSASL